jgi:hypothetical protein
LILRLGLEAHVPHAAAKHRWHRMLTVRTQTHLDRREAIMSTSHLSQLQDAKTALAAQLGALSEKPKDGHLRV